MARRVLGGAILSGFGLYGAYEATNTPNQPQWLRKQRIVISGYRRFLRTLTGGLYVSLDYKLSLMFKDPTSKEYDETMKRCHERAILLITETVLTNGGLYVKLGQTFGSLNHILPEIYVEGLKVLQDRARPQGIKEVEQTFYEEFGKYPTEIFESFNPEPIGAASLAQVHLAKTKDQQEVAVKVQYADLTDRFPADIKTLTLLLNLVTFIHPTFSFGWVLEEFYETLLEELNFTIEAKNSEKCARELSDIPGFHVPEVRWDLTTSRILTMEYINGCKSNDFKKIKEMNLNPTEIMTTILNVFGKQIFITGFVHSDPHPANILIRKQKNGKAEVVLIDHGLYTQIPKESREVLAQVWKAIVTQDDDLLIKSCNEFNVSNPDLFVSMLLQRPYKMGSDVSDVIKKGMTITEADIQIMQEQTVIQMGNIVSILRNIPRPVILVIRNLNLVRSINYDLGAPVNRFYLLAKIAAKGLDHPTEGGLKETAIRKIDSFKFELFLGLTRIKQIVEGMIITVLKALGFIPKEAAELISLLDA